MVEARNLQISLNLKSQSKIVISVVISRDNNQNKIM